MRIQLLPVLLSWTFLAQAQIHHKLSVVVDPLSAQLGVTDEITLQEGLEITFELNAALMPKSLTKGLTLHKVGRSQPNDVGMDRSGSAPTIKWRIAWADRYPNAKNFKIAYAGKIESLLEQSSENYQRGFSESPGIISEKGIYLAGSTFWIPRIGEEMMTFEMKVNLPLGWKSVAQGVRTLSEKETWTCLKPQEEIFLIAAKFTEYSFDAGNVKAMAFLRTPDESIANKYLETTAQYLEMYRGILGLYPYSKFALVENFWETGYGMPSFTLLGEKIIRFPFILHSSYPHELLHNWWGNSVYVDFEKGNWCEGLTAYMADHLIKEQRGKGQDYRRSTLQKYTDLVNRENDFPLIDFRSRTDGASEAIGYGKSLMMWHMLRTQFGDEKFLQAMRKFYKKNKYKKASFIDIRMAFEQVTDNHELTDFFKQWTERKGAPELVLDESIDVSLRANLSYLLSFTIRQKQLEEVFVLDVPIEVEYWDGDEIKTQSFVKMMTSKSQKMVVSVPGKPTKVSIDPMFDLFRILDSKEVPPALTKAYGADKTLIIKPLMKKKGRYDVFAEAWMKGVPGNYEVVYDSEIQRLPEDRTVWILGYENKFASSISMDEYNAKIEMDTVHLPNKKLHKSGNDVILALEHPHNTQEAIVFLSIGNKASIPGLVRKLPHYGKYSYLAFEGDEPTNIAKGQWPVIASPLIKILDRNAPQAKNEKRKALAYLEPVFSSKNMMEHIEYLASKELKGRGLGTPELDKAADYIADAFAQAGLKPGADKNTYFQSWTADVKDKKRVKLKNVIGIIPGSNPKFKEEPVVISAHYDHLGMGWPDAHHGDDGKLHYGADDNASGVAVMLELALRMAKTTKPQRPIIFVAFTGEEAGLVGSRYFVQAGKEKFFANINLDTEGSLFDQKIIILNANTASEWKHIFMGTDYVTGIATQLVMKDLDASDQGSFIEKGIPAVQFFAGATTNYHRPSDTPDKIDAAGLVKVATVAKEVLVYLADRERAMPFTGKVKHGKSAKTTDTGEQKRASTGSVPSFSYEGTGVKIGSVPKGSPAEKAGLLAGDIIINIADEQVEDLAGYSTLLKKLKPGQVVSIKVLRDGVVINGQITLKAR